MVHRHPASHPPRAESSNNRAPTSQLSAVNFQWLCIFGSMIYDLNRYIHITYYILYIYIYYLRLRMQKNKYIRYTGMSFDPRDPTRATRRSNNLKCRKEVSTVWAQYKGQIRWITNPNATICKLPMARGILQLGIGEGEGCDHRAPDHLTAANPLLSSHVGRPKLIWATSPLEMTSMNAFSKWTKTQRSAC